MPSAPVPYLLTILTASVGGGVAVTPEADDVPTSPSWVIRVGAHFDTPKLELEVGFDGVSGETRRIPYPFTANATHLDTLITVADTERVDPYVSLGIGWRSLDISPETRNGLTGPEALDYPLMPATDALASVGIGTRVAVWGPLSLRADTHFLAMVGTEPVDDGTHFYPAFDASISAHFRWDGPPDRDHDGIANKYDKCPTVAEDHDFYDDKDGCPDLDDDHDGIVDTADECKDAAEDKDGFEDENGCPDQNNDRDGFPDVLDHCPMEAEVANGWQDGDGCPDAVPADLVEIVGIHRDIPYDGTAIAPAGDAVLAKVKDALLAHPEAHIEMRAFWDGTNGATAAHERTRAECVSLYRWFEAHGLANNRIAYKYGGDNRPLASDATPEGAATNRRVEIVLVDFVSGDGSKVEFTAFPPEEWTP